MNGGGQTRHYDDKGKPWVDVDWGHHPELDPSHVHWWDRNKDPRSEGVRGDPEPAPPGWDMWDNGEAIPQPRGSAPMIPIYPVPFGPVPVRPMVPLRPTVPLRPILVPLVMIYVGTKENPMTKNRGKICESFSQILWHDSKLLGLHLSRNPEKPQYDLRLDLNLIVGFSEGKVERRKQSALFSDCRIIQTDLDLLGILLCSGDIGAAGCHPDSAELEKRNER